MSKKRDFDIIYLMLQQKILLTKMIGNKRMTAICGAFGTGKTEISVNIALKLAAEQKKRVILVDLDIVNLYFRSRDKCDALAAKGIKVISGAKGFENADLPALAPEILEVFAQKDSLVIFDLGGSDYGGTVLSRFNEYLKNEKINLWLVVNPFRPFNEKNEDTVAMAEHISRRARLPVSGIIANPHLMNQTTDALIEQGLAQINRIQKYPLKFLTVMEDYYKPEMEKEFEIPIMVLSKNMIQPWE